MAGSYLGGCACGAVRYRIEGAPSLMSDCHCRQCQRQGGAGHGSFVAFEGAAVSTTGSPGVWRQTGDQGLVKETAFCPGCGSPTHMTFPTMPRLFVVLAGSLDDPSVYRAQFATWAIAAQPWDPVDPAVPAFDRMPPP